MMQNFCEEHWEKSYQCCQHFYKVRSLWIQILMWSKIMITVLPSAVMRESGPPNIYVPKSCGTCTMQSCTSLGECLVWPFWPKQPSRKRRWIIAHHTTLRSQVPCSMHFSSQVFVWKILFFPNNFSPGDWRTIWQWSRPLNKVFLLLIIITSTGQF